MKIKDMANLSAKQIEEKLTNRMLINFGYTILGYVLLYAFYLYAMGRIGNILTYRYVMCAVFVLLALGTVALYTLSYTKLPKLETYSSTFKNYAHMTLAICLVVFYLNLPFYTKWMPVETVPAAFRSIVVFLKNTRYEYFVVAYLMLAYLVFTFVYYGILIKKFTKKAKKAKKTR
ncbi:MAG: hypothetical protein E7410_02630 [Ruminococcaceae bacterium]|nr:hypothetical protein [Oscillospiraceae bacterium]